jgi:hypothetical protein
MPTRQFTREQHDQAAGGERSFGARLLDAVTHSGPGYQVGAAEVAHLRARVAELEADRDAAVAAAVRRALEDFAAEAETFQAFNHDERRGIERVRDLARRKAAVASPAREQGESAHGSSLLPPVLREAMRRQDEEEATIADALARAREQGEEQQPETGEPWSYTEDDPDGDTLTVMPLPDAVSIDADSCDTGHAAVHIPHAVVPQLLAAIRTAAGQPDRADVILRLVASWAASSEGRDVLVEELAAAGHPLPEESSCS